MSWKSRAKALGREPLMQMLVAGLVVALIAGARAPDYDPESQEIIVSEPAVSGLIEQYSRTWQRMPSEAELDNLIADYVREEALIREARRLGLDEGDAIIRRRLASKMEALLIAEGESAEPSEADIEAYYEENWQAYAPPQSVSFDQIYLGELSGVEAEARAKAVQKQLAEGADWQTLSRTLLIPPSYESAPLERVSREVGGEFAKAAARAPQGKWSGPVSSAYGAHLVRLRSASAPERLPLGSVREEVLADWREDHAQQSANAASAKLVERYKVTIKQP